MFSSFIYLATPYSHIDAAVREVRFERACRISAKLMEKGWLIFSPIAHTHSIAKFGELPTGWDYWGKYDEVMIRNCSAVWVCTMPGWQQSKGIAGEIELAYALGKPVHYICPDTLNVTDKPAN